MRLCWQFASTSATCRTVPLRVSPHRRSLTTLALTTTAVGLLVPPSYWPSGRPSARPPPPAPRSAPRRRQLHRLHPQQHELRHRTHDQHQGQPRQVRLLQVRRVHPHEPDRHQRGLAMLGVAVGRLGRRNRTAGPSGGSRGPTRRAPTSPEHRWGTPGPRARTPTSANVTAAIAGSGTHAFVAKTSSSTAGGSDHVGSDHIRFVHIGSDDVNWAVAHADVPWHGPGSSIAEQVRRASPRWPTGEQCSCSPGTVGPVVPTSSDRADPSIQPIRHGW